MRLIGLSWDIQGYLPTGKQLVIWFGNLARSPRTLKAVTWAMGNRHKVGRW